MMSKSSIMKYALVLTKYSSKSQEVFEISLEKIAKMARGERRELDIRFVKERCHQSS